MRRVLVLGAGGIIGQHLRLQQPADVEAVYTRREDATLFYTPLDLRSPDDLPRLNALVGNKWGGKVDVVINLAGESRPDIVEATPKQYRWANVYLPQTLGAWCDQRDALLLHISTQGVFSGRKAPYGPVMPSSFPPTDDPVNAYGRQKLEAEQWIERMCRNWSILRLTFALGIRPFPTVGRANPLEAMFEACAAGKSQRQVNDRFFSPCFAEDAAQAIWTAAVRYPATRVVGHVGTPIRTNRYQLAIAARECFLMGGTVLSVNHREAFPDVAERPYDTTYTGSWHRTELKPGIERAYHQWTDRLAWYSVEDRGDELAAFFGVPTLEARGRLVQGFGYNHGKVAEDWRAANPMTDEQILQWYRDTPAYCWELSAYHVDPGFNYRGMCEGIALHLKHADARRVLCLGDGIGDLTLVLGEHGLDPIYHDLGGSVTANSAAFRFQRRGATPLMLLTSGWDPPDSALYDALDPKLDAIIAHDFFEHLTNVAEWARACYTALAPGGLFLAQNAFAIGDPEHGGSIPMHLSRNNKYADDDGSGRAGWDTLLDETGFERTGEGNWRRKPTA